MNQVFTANNIKITGKAKSINPLTGSIITNGGIGCVNIFCDADITAESLTLSKSLKINKNINVNGNINIKGNIIPKNGNNSSIGLTNNPWKYLNVDNFTAQGHTIIGFDKDSDPLLDINKKLTIHCDTDIISDGYYVMQIKKNDIEISGNLFVNDSFKIFGNLKTEVKNKLIVDNIVVNNYICINPEFHVVTTSEYTITICSSVVIITLKNDCTLDFILSKDHNNVLVKIILQNFGNYVVHVSAFNKNIDTCNNFELFFFTDNGNCKYIVT